jgi:low temperature requirement protein LtrA
MIWNVWLQSTLFLNRYDQDDFLTTVFVAFNSMAVMCLASNSEHSYTDARGGWAASYASAIFLQSLFKLRIIPFSKEARINLYLDLFACAVSITLVLIGGFYEPASPRVLWPIGVFVEQLFPLLTSVRLCCVNAELQFAFMACKPKHHVPIGIPFK